MITDASALIQLSNQLIVRNLDPEQVFKQMVDSNKLLQFINEFGPQISYALNYRTLKYLYLSKHNIKNIFGYDPSEIFDLAMEEGVMFLHKYFVHPSDSEIMTNQALVVIHKILGGIPIELRNSVRFSINWRARRADGSYTQVLQQFHIISDPSDQIPILSIGTISDINEIKKDTKMVLTANIYDDSIGFKSYKEEFFPKEENPLLSEREIEVAKLLSQGYTPEVIADRLFISTFTVKAHKRKIYEKLEVHKAAEFVQKMQLLGYI